MMHIFHWLKHEIATLIPAIIYFLVCFTLLHFAQNLLMQPDDIHYTSYVGAMIGAILAGKVIFIAENIPFINSFSTKPLVYNVTWKFVVYSFFVVIVQIIDHFNRKLHVTKSWSVSYEQLMIDLSQPMFWGVQILVLMVFFMFTVFHELSNVVGSRQMKKIFFG